MSLRCPHCHMRVELADLLTLSERQRNIRDAIEMLKHKTGKPARSKDIAKQVGWSLRTVQAELSQLETLRVVSRPNGHCSGWSLRRDNLTLVIAA